MIDAAPGLKKLLSEGGGGGGRLRHFFFSFLKMFGSIFQKGVGVAIVYHQPLWQANKKVTHPPPPPPPQKKKKKKKNWIQRGVNPPPPTYTPVFKWYVAFKNIVLEDFKSEGNVLPARKVSWLCHTSF